MTWLADTGASEGGNLLVNDGCRAAADLEHPHPTLIVVLFLAYLAGGYVAGRMARFDGVRQGVAVWVIVVVVTLALALASAVLGAEYDVLPRLDLPGLPVIGDTLATASLVALGAAALISLPGAVLGGRLGTRYHRKIDNTGR